MNAAAGGGRVTVPSTVAARLAEHKKLADEIHATPCAACGHPYSSHGFSHRAPIGCFYPRVVVDGAANCRCKAFVDPVSCLEGTE